MAERRMFAKTITSSDAFLEMPLTTQCLYFHLSMNADDDGFINSPKSIMRMVGARDDDVKILIEKNFVIPFESGVVVIKHWRINNYLRNDRYKPTEYQEEMQQLGLKENKSYTKNNSGIPSGYQMDTQVSIGKVSIGKDRIEERKESSINATKEKQSKRTLAQNPPTYEEVEDYCNKRGNEVDPRYFYDKMLATGWRDKNNVPLKDWKATIRMWERFETKKESHKAFNGQLANPDKRLEDLISSVIGEN